MQKKVVLVDANRVESSQICSYLLDGDYRGVSLDSIDLLAGTLQGRDCMAVIIDIDTIQVDNRDIRNLAVAYPEVRFFGLSNEDIHPGLREAICYHMYACMKKPLDPDELLYWLRSIEEDAE